MPPRSFSVHPAESEGGASGPDRTGAVEGRGHGRPRARLVRAVLWAAALLSGPTTATAQDPPAAGGGFTETPLSVPVSGAVLSGRLLVPEGEGPHPAAILLAGSRDSRNLPGLAEDLARRGLAVLDLDKRGVGGSTGGWRTETLEGRADDVLWALEVVAQRPEVDAARIGVIGHSQGGYVAAMVAARSGDVAFVVLLAGPGQTVRDQVVTHRRIALERGGASDEEVARELRHLGRRLSLASRLGPVCRALRLSYVCGMVDHDPVPWLEEVRAPVLALFTAFDEMVPPVPNAALVREALARGGNPDFTVHVFPQGCHDFMPQAGPREPMLPGFVPGFPGVVLEWVEKRVGPLS